MFLGCQIEEPKLRIWSEDPATQAKLASYALDPQRPRELRRIALESLVKRREYTLLMSIFDLTAQHKDNAEEQLKIIAEECVDILDKQWPAESVSLEEESHIAEASFFLMNVNAFRAEISRHPDLLKKLTKWALDYLNTEGRKVVPPAQDETILLDPQKVLSAILYTAEEEGEELLMTIFQEIKSDQLNHIDHLKYTLRLHQSIHLLKNAKLSEAFASVFLTVAQKAYQSKPHAFDKEVFKAILENNNITLLRFLIELGRDEEAIDRKETQVQDLVNAIFTIVQNALNEEYKGEIRSGVLRMISSKQAHSSLIFDGIYWAWTLGNQDDLKEILTKIPPDFKVPVSGVELRSKVNQICVDINQPDKDYLSKQLEDLLVDLKDKEELWPARLITVTCINQLYPDSKLNELMKTHRLYKNYQNDRKMILAWRSDREVTLGEIVKDYLNPVR
jgi:hypothetical protein